MQKGRPHRVGELIKQEVAQLLIKGLKDPRIGFVSVMSVRMSSDLHYANVYVSLYGTESERKSSLIGLQNSAGWIRREIGKFLRLRYTPELRFFPDTTLDEVYHLEELFGQIHEQQELAPMLHIGIPEVIGELKSAESIVITSHVHPDGDAIGSLLGVYHLLQSLGKKRVQCVLEDPVPQVYRSLPGAKGIKTPDQASSDFDLLAVIDVARFERIGGAAELAHGKRVLIIDHHLEEQPSGTVGFIDASYAAAGEIVAALFSAAEIPLTSEAALCAYVAQITDTGGFRFSNTNARSHRIAADLVGTGLDVAGIASDVFDRVSRTKFEMLRRTLERARFIADGKAAYSQICAKDLEDIGGENEDTNGLVNHLRNVDGVQAGILFNAVSTTSTKVSLRTGPAVNAAALMKEFGGGGHAAAAGATIAKPIEEVRTAILARLEEVLAEPIAAKYNGDQA